MGAYGQLQAQGPTMELSFSKHCTNVVQSDLPIFSQDWWINIARGPSNYRELTVILGRDVVGRLPIVLSRGRLGIVRGHDPYWSHLGGPIVDPSLSRSQQADVVRSLLNQLPRRTSFSFVCDPSLSYADLVREAFIDAGFAHTTQTTYLHLPEDGDVLTTRKSKHRGHFKRAAKSLECVDISALEFVRFFEMNLKAKGRESYAPPEILKYLAQAAISRGCARAIAARPRSCNGAQNGDCSLPSPYDAAIVYVWDATRCYYWLSTSRAALGEDPGSRPHPDAIKLLVFQAIEHAQTMGLIFDADGVATPGADHLYHHILGLRKELRRDVFERINIVDRLYKKCSRGFKRIASRTATATRDVQTQAAEMNGSSNF